MKRRNFKTPLLYGVILLYSLIYLTPFFWMLATSFKPLNEIGRLPITILPKNFTFENYLATWSRVEIFRYFGNSLYLSFLATLISLCIEIISAYSFSRFRFKGQNILLFVVLFTNAIPSLILLVPFYDLLRMMNLINTHLGLLFIYTAASLPFGTWLLIGYFDQVPKELEEAAMVDGCSRLQTIFRVVVPVALPGIIAVGIITFVHWWGDFLFALTFLNDTKLYTLPLGVYAYQGIEWTHWGKLMAVATLLVLPALLIFIVFQKYIISGIVAGALKK